MTVPAWAEDTAVHPSVPPLPVDVELDEVVEFVPLPVVVVLFPVAVPPVSVVFVVVVFPFPVACLFWWGSTNAPWSLTPATHQRITLVSRAQDLPLLAVHPSSVYVAPSITELYPPEIVSLVSVGMMYSCPLETYTLLSEFVVISNSPFLRGM